DDAAELSQADPGQDALRVAESLPLPDVAAIMGELRKDTGQTDEDTKGGEDAATPQHPRFHPRGIDFMKRNATCELHRVPHWIRRSCRTPFPLQLTSQDASQQGPIIAPARVESRTFWQATR